MTCSIETMQSAMGSVTTENEAIQFFDFLTSHGYDVETDAGHVAVYNNDGGEIDDQTWLILMRKCFEK